MDEFSIPGLAAAQLSYHLRMAVGLAATGAVVESASETALAWTILSMHEQLEPALLAQELPELTAGTQRQRDALARTTEALALQLQAHFVSEGQYAAATMYESAAARVRATMAATHA